jgi:hypothetical protein
VTPGCLFPARGRNGCSASRRGPLRVTICPSRAVTIGSGPAQLPGLLTVDMPVIVTPALGAASLISFVMGALSGLLISLLSSTQAERGMLPRRPAALATARPQAPVRRSAELTAAPARGPIVPVAPPTPTVTQPETHWPRDWVHRLGVGPRAWPPVPLRGRGTGSRFTASLSDSRWACQTDLNRPC